MVRLNQAALDLLQVELRSRTRSSYAPVKFADALKSFDADQTSVSTAESEDMVNQLVAHRLQRLHDRSGNSATYGELRQTVVDLIPNFPDTVLHKAAKLNRPALAEVPMAWPGLPLMQWSSLVLGAMVGGIGVLVLPLMQSFGTPDWRVMAQQLKLPMVSVPPIATLDLPRSNELIPTAETFAGIVRQSMQAPALSAAEWQKVINQWQEAIDLLAQVPQSDFEYRNAQHLIQSYKQQQTQAKTQLQQERQATEAVKAAQGRVSWLLKRIKKMPPQQRAEALKAVEVQLQPVGKGTTSYAAGQQLRDRLKQSIK
jgi:hypothetical protein